MLVDSHCHLDFKDFDGELDAIMARAAARGVHTMVTIGTKLGEFDRVRAIAERYDHVYCTVGVHPHEAEAEDAASIDRLVELAQHRKVVGIGETGLDALPHRRGRLDRGDQHIELAELALPLPHVGGEVRIDQYERIGLRALVHIERAQHVFRREPLSLFVHGHDPRHSRTSNRLRRSQVLIVFAGALNCAAS